MTASPPPEESRQVLDLHHAVRSGHHCLVLAFHYVVLLWGVQSGQLTSHPRHCAVLAEVDRDEFPTMISAKTPPLLPGHSFHLSLHPLDCFCCTTFRWEEDNPHILVEVVDHQQEELLAAWCPQGDGAAEVPMNKLEVFP
jgi:hypothetical protein